MRFLGIDYGTKRIGLALSDESGRFAFPNSVLENDISAMSTILRLVRENNVGKIVIGESRDYKGNPNPILAASKRFAEKVATETGLLVVLEPEFLTSAEAARIQGEGKTLDASAAALILKSYLDKQPHE